MDISDVIESILCTEITGILAPRGWERTKRSHTWRTSVSDLVMFVNLQRWPRWPRNTFRGTINLGLTSHKLRDLAPQWLGEDALWSCPIQVRIGQLMPEGTDQWWDVLSVSQAPEAGKQLCCSLQDFGLPFFERFKTTDDVVTGMQLPMLGSPQFAPVVLRQIAGAFYGNEEVPAVSFVKETVRKWLETRPVLASTLKAAREVSENEGFYGEFEAMLIEYEKELRESMATKKRN